VHTIEIAELSVHRFVSKVFAFLSLIYYWITEPVMMIRVTILHSEWIPLKNFKGYYVKYVGDKAIIRHKSKPGQFIADIHADPQVTLANMLDYFGV
jgi:hypothetical protein